VTTSVGLRSAARFVVRLPQVVVVLLLRGYRAVISPLYGPTCRFYPSCSAYALAAVETHGVIQGGWLAVKRLLRCNPWNLGGVDPVPPVEGRSHERAVESAECSVEVGGCSPESVESPAASAGLTSAPSSLRRVA
jgi:uncharacterized protein